MQDLLHARQVDFRIFNEGMVSLDQQRGRRQQQQPKIVQDLLLVRKNFHSPIATATFDGSIDSSRFHSATHDATAWAASTAYCGSMGRR